ncbi:serine O-acetyltransferase [Campylobacter fetus]|uniref:Serine acetyltransferase n=2 Tax=Campylobacter fetus TaxID=196 RepID=A0AAX0HBN6_CAMFE|nr:serine O-acetyltransferase [Campylobacter fetus]AGZ81757.1 serine O-acetyltransferase [Campylobacter fetus subsp. testudinum 03-427]AJB45490.1 serine acetyltransferase [Campylobacter fetus subsp. testudinum]ALV64914.1 serine O-acetyltransferase [Campylobacter fetus subsp. testudinum Sp3]AVK81160.1 serine O-acetyltransferase [Campylobacter fetus subsp. testudinum]EAI4321265.1 serine O-acetyltransferase [Campylobacter fetus]
MSFWNIIKEDLSQPKVQDPAYRCCVELVFNYPGVWAIVNYRFTHFLWEKKWHNTARVLAGISNFLTRVDLHPAAKIGRRVFIDHATGVVIGETTVIGNDCLIYQGVTFGGVSLDKGKRHPTLEDGVVVGAGAKILGNITIGKGSKIGANSVVVKDVGANCTAVGVPARAVGGCAQPFEHNKLPDITKEMIGYLIKKLEILEKEVAKSNNNIIKPDIELDELYKQYIKSIKE